MLNIAIVRQWTVRTPFVYRFMQAQYVDEFFATGRLRLSCFFEFKQRESEETGDRWEGWNLLIGAAGAHTVAAVAEYGANSLVLSTTAVHDASLYAAFGADSCFRINDTSNFAAA